MRLCNYCKLRNIKRRAKKEGKSVEVKNDPFHIWKGGKIVYVDEGWAAWFAELSKKCVC